jgi:hypothetical protein
MRLGFLFELKSKEFKFLPSFVEFTHPLRSSAITLEMSTTVNPSITKDSHCICEAHLRLSHNNHGDAHLHAPFRMLQRFPGTVSH